MKPVIGVSKQGSSFRSEQQKNPENQGYNFFNRAVVRAVANATSLLFFQDTYLLHLPSKSKFPDVRDRTIPDMVLGYMLR
jgi:hypothetical protein